MIRSADEITFPRRRRPDRPRLIGQFDWRASRVGLRIDRDRGDPRRRAVAMTRQAISPRLAIRILRNIEVLTNTVVDYPVSRGDALVGREDLPPSLGLEVAQSRGHNS